MASISTDSGELSIETEQIDITSGLPYLDEAWRFMDAAGHEHYWQDGFPTLVEVVDGRYYCGECAEDHVESHLECPQCGETITPGTKVDTFRRYMPGRASYTLDGEPISEERARRLIEARRQ